VFDADWVSRVMTRLGKVANVVVARTDKPDKKAGAGKVKTVVKYASAHDLRRSFGTLVSANDARRPSRANAAR
jgi:hypothetical protein